MATINEREFLTKIRQNEQIGLCFLYGPDDYSKEICLNKLLKSVNPSTDIKIFNGSEMKLVELQNECCSVSFFSSEKCVVVKNPPIDSFSSEQTKQLNEIINTKPESCLLCFISTSTDINTRSSSKWANFIKKIDKDGIVVTCLEKSRANVISMIESTVKKRGCSISSSLAGEICDRCLNDMVLINSELEKLCSYALSKNSGDITLDAVEALTAQQLDYKAFEIIKHILSKKSDMALKVVNSLFLEQVDAVAINAAVASSFVDIYRVKLMAKHNHSNSELSAEYDYKGKDYKLRNAGYDANKCSLSFVKNAILQLTDADVKLKSSKQDKKSIIEEAIINIIFERALW